MKYRGCCCHFDIFLRSPRKSNFHWKIPISSEQICCHCFRCSWNIMQKKSSTESDREVMFALCATLCRHTIFFTHLSRVKKCAIKYKMISGSQHFLCSAHQFFIENAADCWTLILTGWRKVSLQTIFNEWIAQKPINNYKVFTIKPPDSRSSRCFRTGTHSASKTCCIIALTTFYLAPFNK